MINEESELEKILRSALKLMQKRKYSELAELGLQKHLIFTQESGELGTDATAAQVGKALYKWLADQIEGMHPHGEFDSNDDDWRYYVILKNHFLDDLDVIGSANEIHVARATFFELQKSAIKILAELITAAEKDARYGSKEINNLEEIARRFPEPYVLRVAENGVEYVDWIINLIQDGKEGIITVIGGPEVGKSRTAYESAKRCVEESLSVAVIFVQIDKLARNYSQDAAVNYGRYAPLEEILNTIGDILKMRNVREKRTIEEKSKTIYEVMAQKKPTLLVLDGLDWINPAEEEQLGMFLAEIPSPSVSLLTCRFAPQFYATPVELHGLEWAEATTWMRNEAQRLIMLVPPKADLRWIYDHSGQGVPTAMRYWMQQIKFQGLKPDEVVIKKGDADFEQAFSHILDDSFGKLYHRDPESLKLLYVLTIFASSAEAKSIAAAAGIEQNDAMACLGLLHRASLVERRDGRFDLLDIVRKCLWSAQYQELPNGESLLEFIDEAQCRLAKFYKNELKGKLIGERVRFLGTEKNTIFAVLEWCDQKNHYEELIGLVDSIGRPLGIIGRLAERLKWGKRAMLACEKTDEPYWRDWFACHDVAWTLSRTGNRGEAIGLWEESLHNADASDLIQYRAVKALAMRNLAQDILNNKPDKPSWTRAIEQLQQSISNWEEIKEWEWAGHSLEVLGLAYFENEAYSQALPYLQKAHAYLESVDHKDGTISTLAEISCVMWKTGHETEALRFMNQAVEQAQEMEQPAPALAYVYWRQAQVAAWRREPKAKVNEIAKKALSIYNACFASRWANEAQGWLEAFMLS